MPAFRARHPFRHTGEDSGTSRDMSGIPMVRPARFGMREYLTPEEFKERL
jgi:hypothetical protein